MLVEAVEVDEGVSVVVDIVVGWVVWMSGCRLKLKFGRRRC